MKQETAIHHANTGLDSWLTVITDLQEGLEAVVENGGFVNLPEGKPRYRGTRTNGIRVGLRTLPNKTSITVAPRDETTLSGGRFVDGRLDDGHEYTAKEPFAGGVLLRADFYSREKTGESGPVGFNLLCVQRPSAAYPNDYSPEFYVAEAVIVSGDLLPQVDLAVVHDPKAIPQRS